jgi:hypothetical protein
LILKLENTEPHRTVSDSTEAHRRIAELLLKQVKLPNAEFLDYQSNISELFAMLFIV